MSTEDNTGGTYSRLPKLDIIFVNRNSGLLLRHALESLEKASTDGFELRLVSVIDDCSTDGSADSLIGMALPLRVVKNQRRLGYGSSCNVGAKGSEADYLLFLNTDICVAPDSLSVPIAYMQNRDNGRVGIIGIKLVDKSGEINRCCARFPKPSTFLVYMLGLNLLFPGRFRGHLMREWDHLATREVDQVMGAFMLMRRPLFDSIGGYDESFFVYMEDLDLTLRARTLGVRSVYLAEVSACHLGGVTAAKAPAESLFFNIRSRTQYGFKHFGATVGALLAIGAFVVEPVSRLIYGLIAPTRYSTRDRIQAYRMLWGWLLSRRGDRT
jgi:GT2 family glycosyltransferase